MRGTLKVEDKEQDILSLTIRDIIEHFKNIDEVTFTTDIETNNSYFDIVIQVYLKAFISFSDLDQELVKEFHKLIQKLFSDKEKREKLIELGATDVDFALINHNQDTLKKIAYQNTETDMYQLAKIYRFVDIAQYIGEKFNPFKIDITIGNNSNISLGSLRYQAFEYCSESIIPKNAFINIQDAGNKTWNYGDVAFWNKNIKFLIYHYYLAMVLSTSKSKRCNPFFICRNPY